MSQELKPRLVSSSRRVIGMAASISTLTSLNTKLNADAVEWCPITEFHDLLICANYELDQQPLGEKEGDNVQDEPTAKQSRAGYLYLFKLLSDLTLIELSKTSTPGILDCKWSRHMIHNSACLAAVDSTGKLRILKLNDEGTHLLEVAHIQLSKDSNTLALSLDWSNFLQSTSDEVSIIASDSAGFVHLVSFNGTDLTLNVSLKGHDFEAWIAAFDYHNSNVFYSGGDDSILKMYDARASLSASLKLSRAHAAGVTSIQCNWSKEHSMVTGSYDERVLFWDHRTMKHPLSEVKAPGGVWRIKHDPFDAHMVACPCMYGGSAVIDSSSGEPRVVAAYEFHKDINYGIDWYWRKVSRDSKSVFVLSVCSFYDKLLSLSELCTEQ